MVLVLSFLSLCLHQILPVALFTPQIRDAKIKVLQVLAKECKGKDVKLPREPSQKEQEVVAAVAETVGGAGSGDDGAAASKKEPWQEFLELASSLKVGLERSWVTR